MACSIAVPCGIVIVFPSSDFTTISVTLLLFRSIGNSCVKNILVGRGLFTKAVTLPFYCAKTKKTTDLDFSGHELWSDNKSELEHNKNTNNSARRETGQKYSCRFALVRPAPFEFHREALTLAGYRIARHIP